MMHKTESMGKIGPHKAANTLAGFSSLQEEEKKSRFVCSASPVSSVDEAQTFFDRVRDSGASHNTWAYKIGAQCRFSDDGEVSGTAGKPMFGAIEKQGLDQVAVMVTRYYGGIKLGTGGLTRAYGGVAARCLQNAIKQPIQSFIEARLKISFRAMGKVLDLLKNIGVQTLEKKPEFDGFSLKIRYEVSLDKHLKTALQNCLGCIPDLEYSEDKHSD